MYLLAVTVEKSSHVADWALPEAFVLTVNREKPLMFLSGIYS